MAPALGSEPAAQARALDAAGRDQSSRNDLAESGAGSLVSNSASLYTYAHAEQA